MKQLFYVSFIKRIKDFLCQYFVRDTSEPDDIINLKQYSEKKMLESFSKEFEKYLLKCQVRSGR